MTAHRSIFTASLLFLAATPLALSPVRAQEKPAVRVEVHLTAPQFAHTFNDEQIRLIEDSAAARIADTLAAHFGFLRPVLEDSARYTLTVKLDSLYRSSGNQEGELGAWVSLTDSAGASAEEFLWIPLVQGSARYEGLGSSPSAVLVSLDDKLRGADYTAMLERALGRVSLTDRAVSETVPLLGWYIPFRFSDLCLARGDSLLFDAVVLNLFGQPVVERYRAGVYAEVDKRIFSEIAANQQAIDLLRDAVAAGNDGMEAVYVLRPPINGGACSPESVAPTEVTPFRPGG